MKSAVEILLVAVVALIASGLVSPVASPAQVGTRQATVPAAPSDDADDDDSGDNDAPPQPVVVAAPAAPEALPPAISPAPLPAQPSPLSSGAAVPLRPFPLVRIRGRATSTGARLSLLAIRAPAGASVVVHCGGRSCPRRRIGRLSNGNPVRVRALERDLRAGTVVRVSVTRAGAVGKYTLIRIRRMAAPARIDRCLVPGARFPRLCS